MPDSAMVPWRLDVIIPVAVVLGVVLVPMLCPAAAPWLLVVVLLLNILLLLPLLLLLLSPRLSLSLMTAVSQILLIPFSRTHDLYAHFVQDPPPHQDLALRIGPGGISSVGLGDDRRLGGDGVAVWMRQVVFLLTLLLGEPRVALGGSVIRFLFWLLGIRTFLSVLATVLLLHLPDQESDGTAQRDTSARENVSDDLALFSQPVYLLQLLLSVSSLIHCALSIPSLDLLGFVVFSVCSDQRIQEQLKSQARKIQVDALEGFEAEILHGVLILLDLLVCLLFFARALLHKSYLVLVLSYCNGFVALMELRVRVWQEMQTGLRRLSELQRASSVELRAHNDVCAVCLGSMSAARITQCRHLFHGKCLRQALRVSPQCPLCKENIVRHHVYVLDPVAELQG